MAAAVARSANDSGYRSFGAVFTRSRASPTASAVITARRSSSLAGLACDGTASTIWPIGALVGSL